MNWIRRIIDFMKKSVSKKGKVPVISVPIRVTGHKAPEPRKTYPFNAKGFKPSWIVIHHSATKDSGTKNWDAIRKYHIEVRGWAEIAYTFGVENVNGKLTILEGRTIGNAGAHALGFNRQSIGICLVGNYDTDPPSEDRLACMAVLCRDLQRQFKIPSERVVGHRETYQLRGVPVEKSCPGTAFNLNDFRARLG